MDNAQQTPAQQIRNEAALIEQKAFWRESLLKDEQNAFADDDEISVDTLHRWESLKLVILDLRCEAHQWRDYADHLEDTAAA